MNVQAMVSRGEEEPVFCGFYHTGMRNRVASLRAVPSINIPRRYRSYEYRFASLRVLEAALLEQRARLSPTYDALRVREHQCCDV